jgi:hypothetical protein
MAGVTTKIVHSCSISVFKRLARPLFVRSARADADDFETAVVFPWSNFGSRLCRLDCASRASISTLQRKKGSSAEEKKVGCQTEKSTAFLVAHFAAGIGVGGRTADR